MTDIRFTTGSLTNSQQQILTNGFSEHSQQKSAPEYAKEQINWLVYDNHEKLIGALTAEILWDWIYIDELWVAKDYRQQGIAARLMKKAEAYAMTHQQTGLWLWTQSWQAADFYQKLGYSEFTRFDDFPKGHQRVGFRKFTAINETI